MNFQKFFFPSWLSKGKFSNLRCCPKNNNKSFILTWPILHPEINSHSIERERGDREKFDEIILFNI